MIEQLEILNASGIGYSTKNYTLFSFPNRSSVSLISCFLSVIC